MAQLNEALKSYVSDTYNYIRRVQSFSSKSQDWGKSRDAEIAVMNRILEKTDESNCDQDLQELSAALEKTRSGLQLMEDFVDALERLAVTSSQLFETSSRDDLQAVCCIIQTAQALCPQLISFKRDNKAFFQTKLENTEVLLVQLEKYRYDVENICQVWQDESLYPSHFRNVTSKDVQTNLDQINLLSQIRTDADFRMVYLFQGREKDFTSKFRTCHSKMCDSLKELEGCAERLDNMNKRANISGVTSSAMGIGGGAMSIAGIALAPFTFGLSLGLTAAGATLGVAGAVTSVVTDATEAGVHETETKKAEEKFSEFSEAANEIQSCLENVIEQHFKDLEHNLFCECKDLGKKAKKVYTRLKKTAKHIKAFRAFRAGKLAKTGMKVASRTGKFLGVAGAVFSIGFDIYSIVEHSKNLQNGCETPISKWIRARVALWRGEIDTWHKMCESVERGQRVSSKYKALQD